MHRLTHTDSREAPASSTADMAAGGGLLPDQFFEAVCRGSPDVIVIADAGGEITFVNDRVYELLGYRPEELVGKQVEVLIPGDAEKHRQRRAGYLDAPEARPMGKRPALSALHKSGQEIPVDVALSPLSVSGETGLVMASIRSALPRWSALQDQHVQSVALNAAANGIVITDRAGIIQWANPAVGRMTGYSMAELLGQHTRMLKSGSHTPEFYKELWDTVLSGKTWFGSITNKRKDGSTYYEEQHIAPVVDEIGNITHFIAVKQDITARTLAEEGLKSANEELRSSLDQIQALHEQLRDQALRDSLTGLFNRRYLEETMKRERSRIQRDHSTLSVVWIDLDNFKQVNDTLGHAAGDIVLKSLADLLQNTIRPSDVACRMGGDEFIIVLPGASLAAAEKKAELWREAFYAEQARAASPGGLRCSLSLGVAELRGVDESTDALLKRADDNMYEAKEAGRNRVIARA